MAPTTNIRGKLTWEEMIVKAVHDLNDRKGSSSQAIKKFIINNFFDPMKTIDSPIFKRGLESALEKQVLVRLSGTGVVGSFRLPRKGDKLTLEVKRQPEPEVNSTTTARRGKPSKVPAKPPAKPEPKGKSTKVLAKPAAKPEPKGKSSKVLAKPATKPEPKGKPAKVLAPPPKSRGKQVAKSTAKAAAKPKPQGKSAKVLKPSLKSRDVSDAESDSNTTTNTDSVSTAFEALSIEDDAVTGFNESTANDSESVTESDITNSNNESSVSNGTFDNPAQSNESTNLIRETDVDSDGASYLEGSFMNQREIPDSDMDVTAPSSDESTNQKHNHQQSAKVLESPLNSRDQADVTRDSNMEAQNNDSVSTEPIEDDAETDFNESTANDSESVAESESDITNNNDDSSVLHGTFDNPVPYDKPRNLIREADVDSDGASYLEGSFMNQSDFSDSEADITAPPSDSGYQKQNHPQADPGPDDIIEEEDEDGDDSYEEGDEVEDGDDENEGESDDESGEDEESGEEEEGGEEEEVAEEESEEEYEENENEEAEDGEIEEESDDENDATVVLQPLKKLK